MLLFDSVVKNTPIGIAHAQLLSF
ncbi:hypothetical protein CBM2626_A10120 [Cupriavidus taiwanensis]|nr:hypothetical protein CBM2626_A10120 [Cupriavidus taiwanensis]